MYENESLKLWLDEVNRNNRYLLQREINSNGKKYVCTDLWHDLQMTWYAGFFVTRKISLLAKTCTDELETWVDEMTMWLASEGHSDILEPEMSLMGTDEVNVTMELDPTLQQSVLIRIADTEGKDIETIYLDEDELEDIENKINAARNYLMMARKMKEQEEQQEA